MWQQKPYHKKLLLKYDIQSNQVSKTTESLRKKYVRTQWAFLIAFY